MQSFPWENFQVLPIEQGETMPINYIITEAERAYIEVHPIRFARLQKDMSIKELAAMTGVSSPVIAAIESWKKKQVHVSILYRLSAVLEHPWWKLVAMENLTAIEMDMQHTVSKTEKKRRRAKRKRLAKARLAKRLGEDIMEQIAL
jgi:DNA-binding Xre family transcriptional regulator